MPQVHTYKIISYINASHAVRWAGGTGKPHNHTWEVISEIQLDQEQLIPFNDIEALINSVFEPYTNQYLNEVPPFDQTNPTLENITKLVFKKLSAVMAANQSRLVRLEVGESPTRFYCISLKGD
ncbi:6-carboxytetrahydropterin synthase [Lactiplantibacillus fabifermentans]|uniref:6-carboxy-5,6,7,8-tetrahydropterin synthase n=1 Tax=Lactiplantibacillus fabifermentans T30PCM01 TaxID=1400520 RepID=W6TCP2_9LACO|nr:6-carboxytetrahydropterin synthase [Lactiplantibacillus fabifermentans]ETY74735.1 6-pyruvoyl-tetrahydropterin synthase [Lactiplantibacillus fabifermentans T30PCM01]